MEIPKTMQAALENKGEPTKLSYSLTPLQRVINPPERLLFAVGGTFGLAMAAWGILMAPGAQKLVIGGAAAIFLLVFRRPLVSFYRCLFADKYINTVEIGNDAVAFGVNGLQAKRSRRPLKVARGLCGTFVVRSPYGYSLVIPK